MMKMIESLKKWRSARKGGPLQDNARDKLMQAFRVKYSNFQTLLESNTELLKIISDVEQKLRGQTVFGTSYIEAQTMRSIFHCARMVQCLEKMAGRSYPGLQKGIEQIHHKIKSEAGEATPAKAAATGLIMPYARISQQDAEWVGAKNANICEVKNQLGLRTPEGFAITAAAFEHFIQANHLNETIMRLKSKADLIETDTIVQVGEEIQKRLLAAQVPPDLLAAIRQAHERLTADLKAAQKPLNVSMRSSAIGEDSALSFAGQYLTVLNVPADGLIDAYKQIAASLFSAHAISYRLHMAIPFQSSVMAVACQEMIDARASGVMYTRNPVNPLENHILIKAVWGLGPYAVDGVVTPDTYIFSKQSPPRLLDAKTAEKQARLTARADGSLAAEAVPDHERRQACLTDTQARELAEQALRLEAHFGQPQDIEWALDRQDRIVILQTRPLRVDANETGGHTLQSEPIAGYRVLLEGGDIACVGVGCGPAFHVRTESDLADFPDGGILVTTNASAHLVMAMPKARAILAGTGNVAGHMAALTREYMIPTLLNLRKGIADIAQGAELTVDAFNGRVYQGRVPELAESSYQIGGVMRNTPVYQALRRRADLIVPLNLTNPKSPRFTPENCRTVHDIMRFIHEKAYEEIFQLGDLVTERGKLSVHLKATIPIDLYIIDLGGGLSVDAVQLSEVKTEEVLSRPFKSLLAGMLHKDLQYREPRPIHLGGLLSVMSNQWLSPPNVGAERFGDRSYAIISDRYLNFSSRVGYHYSILDCHCGQTLAKNYINFQFKGGAADPLRRNRRARLIEKVLIESGFVVSTVEDRVSARIAKQEAAVIAEKLELLGRLLIYTRQMDMLMHNELLVDKLARCFLDGNYTLQPEAQAPECGLGGG